MMSRVAALIAGVAILTGDVAHASPYRSQGSSPTLENRAQLVAAHMSPGESYDQATREVPLPNDELSQAITQEMNSVRTYRQARLMICERTDVINARWSKHQAAMRYGGSHEAGWPASTGH